MSYYNNTGSWWSRIPPVVKNLIMINIIMYIATVIFGNVMYEKLALFPFNSPLFHPYQILTHMFMHGGFWHIFFNMYTLFFFGCILENVWGGKKFLLFYLVTGIGAALCHSGVLYLQEIHALRTAGEMAYAQILATPTVGASGAIYGLLLAYGMMFPNNQLQLIFPIPIALKAKWFVMIFGGIELVTGLKGMGGNVAHFAHLGGMLFGYFMIVYWKKKGKMYF